jgi:hypothetical protein
LPQGTIAVFRIYPAAAGISPGRRPQTRRELVDPGRRAVKKFLPRIKDLNYAAAAQLKPLLVVGDGDSADEAVAQRLKARPW